MSVQATAGKEVWPMKMGSTLSPGPVLRLLLFLAQPRSWIIIALQTTGRPAAQPLTQAITEDRETQTKNDNNSLQVQHRQSQRANHNREIIIFSSTLPKGKGLQNREH